MGVGTDSLNSNMIEFLKNDLEITIFIEFSATNDKQIVEIAAPLAQESVIYFFNKTVGEDETNDEVKPQTIPLSSRIQEMGALNEHSVILISKAHPSLIPVYNSKKIKERLPFEPMKLALYALSKHHELAIINDMLVFYPIKKRNVIDRFATQLETSLLRVPASFLDEMDLKENTINELKAELVNKDSLIFNLKQKVNSFKNLPILRWGVRLSEILRPRIGNLNQYAPRPLSTLKKFPSPPKNIAPKISIVTPSFGQGAFIEKTLQSVLEQDYPNLEYFVQDGGSTDETIEILKKYETRLSGWVSELDGGQSQAINRGFRCTNGEIMGWLNSDDLLLPGALNCVSDYFIKHPEIDVVYGDRLLINQQGMEIGRWILPEHDNKILSWVDYVPQETMFWRRRVWDKAGGHIDETFRFAMDWDLITRFREVGARFAHIKRFMGAFRIHDSQKTLAMMDEVGYKEMDRIRERELGHVPSKKQIRRAALPFIIKHLARDIVYRIKKKSGHKMRLGR